MPENNKTDEQLTQQQIAKREKRARQRAKKREAAAAEKNVTAKSSTTVAKQGSSKQAEKRLSPQEYAEQRLNTKKERIERNPDAAVVSFAETGEARSLAFKIDEISVITDYTRSNMGSAKIPFAVGEKLLTMFKTQISEKVDEFIDLASSFGIGTRRTLVEYKEKQRKLANQEKAKQVVIAQEIESETKERLAEEKAIEKAQEAFDKAQEAFQKAQEQLNDSLAKADDGFKLRRAAQEQRAREAKIKAQEEREKAKQEAAAKKSAEKTQEQVELAS